mmetsp:Transcript_11908/g.26469  ORF Transcript_11908/g.26469 Transcript_11908/m.26469 type:complete len:120 (+) Transcript_11908:64-423(+)
MPAMVKVVAGAWHSCSLWDDGKVACWGAQQSGQLGFSHRTDTNAFSGFAPFEDPADDIVAGISATGTCASILGRLKCWGYVGGWIDSTSGEIFFPAGWSQVVIGRYAACVLHTGKLRST